MPPRASRLPRVLRPLWRRTIWRILQPAVRWLFALPAIGGGWTSFLASYFRRGSMVVSAEAGAGTLGPRVVVFCHFDGGGQIRAHTRRYIDALRAEGLGIAFVTNAGRLAPEDLDWIRNRAAQVIIRRNQGYDFGAWRDAIAHCRLPQPETTLLLIANDSVYGPFRPLGPLLQRLDFTAADVWGLTDSWQHRFHLQSYFVAFGPAALASPAFLRFWRGVGNVRSKWWIITRYEIGLTRACEAAGLRCRAVWPYEGLIEMVRTAPDETAAADPFAQARQASRQRILDAVAQEAPLNATADLWRALIVQGMPFIKRELVQSNPSGVPDAAFWPAVVGPISEADRALIARDVANR